MNVQSDGNGGAVVTLTKVGKVLGWAVMLVAALLGAQFFAFRAFAASDRSQLREELGAQMRAEIASAMSKVVTQSDKEALVARMEIERQQLQRQIDEVHRDLDRHLEKFQAALK